MEESNNNQRLNSEDFGKTDYMQNNLYNPDQNIRGVNNTYNQSNSYNQGVDYYSTPNNYNQSASYEQENVNSRPVYPYPSHPPAYKEDPMTTGQWLFTFFIVMIPCVNIVMLLVWAFADTGNKNRKNYSRAMLIYTVVTVIVTFVFGETIQTIIYSLIDMFFGV